MDPRHRRERDRDRNHNGQPHGNPPGSNSGFYLLTGGGAYYLPGGGDSSGYTDESGAPDQADNRGQDDTQMADTGASAIDQDVQQGGEMASNDTGESEPIPDEGQFTLILRDGSSIQAVAFTHTSGKIIYITTEGMRRSFADSLLDSDQTVRVNQERGTPLQLPL